MYVRYYTPEFYICKERFQLKLIFHIILFYTPFLFDVMWFFTYSFGTLFTNTLYKESAIPGS